jgi:3-oxoacyl-[acyl-carrier-protein] synthase II
VTLRDVVITGVGAVTPLGVGARVLHERWTAGACGIRDGEAPCTDFTVTDHLTSKEARRADRSTQLAITAGDEAVADAGWADELPYDSELIGCVLGTGIGGISTLETNHDSLRDSGPGAVSPLAVPLMMSNAGSAALSLRHRLRGPVFSVVSACAAGSHAIGTALRMIQHGEAEAMVTGGAEAPLTPLSRAGFGNMNALSPSGISRPFDARRDGFVLGEGAGVLVLENGDSARARGARILGTLRGYGSTGDAHHITAPHKEGRGGARAMSIALSDSGLTPEDVDYINAHGTSTQLNDRAETLALKLALGERAAQIPVSSTKSAIGHLLGAAGAVEAVATLLALRDRIAPPTIGWEERDDGLDLDYVPGAARPLKMSNGRPPIALSNSFGFGGHNATLCLQAA